MAEIIETNARVIAITRQAIDKVVIREHEGRLIVEGETAEGRASVGPVDRIIAATGQRPDLGITRELRLELDPWLESAKALGPLIDRSLHSCGSAPSPTSALNC